MHPKSLAALVHKGKRNKTAVFAKGAIRLKADGKLATAPKNRYEYIANACVTLCSWSYCAMRVFTNGFSPG